MQKLSHNKRGRKEIKLEISIFGKFHKISSVKSRLFEIERVRYGLLKVIQQTARNCWQYF